LVGHLAARHHTGTTIVTLTQNRDTQALQLKLDELIRVNTAARNALMGLEESSESEVEDIIKSAFVELATSTEETAYRAQFPSSLNYL
jgi:low affinity Fe/Cu permease